MFLSYLSSIAVPVLTLTNPQLGFVKSESPALGTAWLSPKIARVDTHCLTSLGADGAIHPQNRDPNFCRQQFRHLLFNDRIDRILPQPQLIPLSILFGEAELFPSKNLGALVQLSALAPVLAVNPALATSGREFSVAEKTVRVLGQRLPVLIQSSEQLDSLELWIDPESDNRVRRAIFSQDGRRAGQVDFQYRESMPTGWIILEFAPDGFVIDFLKVSVTDSKSVDSIDRSIFQLDRSSGKLRGWVELRASRTRDFFSFISASVSKPDIPGIFSSRKTISKFSS